MQCSAVQRSLMQCSAVAGVAVQAYVHGAAEGYHPSSYKVTSTPPFPTEITLRTFGCVLLVCTVIGRGPASSARPATGAAVTAAKVGGEREGHNAGVHCNQCRPRSTETTLGETPISNQTLPKSGACSNVANNPRSVAMNILEPSKFTAKLKISIGPSNAMTSLVERTSAEVERGRRQLHREWVPTECFVPPWKGGGGS